MMVKMDKYDSYGPQSSQKAHGGTEPSGKNRKNTVILKQFFMKSFLNLNIFAIFAAKM